MTKGRVSKMYDDTVDAIKGLVGAKRKAKKPAKSKKITAKPKTKAKKKKK
jgi:hypothetical protein